MGGGSLAARHRQLLCGGEHALVAAYWQILRLVGAHLLEDELRLRFDYGCIAGTPTT